MQYLFILYTCAMSLLLLLLLLLLCTNNTVMFTHLGAVTFLAVQKLCARARITGRRVAGKGRCLWSWNHLLFANSFSKDVSPQGPQILSTHPQKFDPLYRGKRIWETSIIETPLCMSTHSLTMRRILFYIQLFICHGTDKASARPDRPWGPPNLLYNGYRVFPGG